MSTSVGTAVRRIMHAGVIALLMATVIVPAAFAAGSQKLYAADIGTHSVGAGTTKSYTLTIVNESNAPKLGSVNVIPPNGWTIVSAGQPSPRGTASVNSVGVLELRNLAIPAGATATESFSAQAPCHTSPNPASWTTLAKQSNDFQGPPGNDFILDTSPVPPIVTDLTTSITGTCTLDFVVQPAQTTEVDQIVAGRTAPAIQVRVLSAEATIVDRSPTSIGLSLGSDPSGGTATLSGGDAITTSSGIATFPAVSVDTHGFGYSLVASSTSPGVTAGTSSSFDIVDEAVDCSKNACVGSSTSATTTGQVAADSSQGLLSVTVGAFGGLDCLGYEEPANDTVTFDFTGPTTKTVIITMAKAIVDRPASQIQFCFGRPVADGTFVTRAGTLADDADGDGIYEGLLPDCAKKSPVPPCTLSRVKNADGSVSLTAVAPAGDPHGR
jgi:hypothetical protein